MGYRHVVGPPSVLPPNRWQQPHTHLAPLAWLRSGLSAVTDQGFFSLANFLLFLLVARWVEPEQLGAFAFAYSTFLLLATLHTSFLSEPVLVLGAGKYHSRWSNYIATVLYAHIAFSVALVPVCLLLAASLPYLAGRETAPALASLAIAAPLMLFYWLVRRALYVLGKVFLAALGAISYFLLILALAYLFRLSGRFSPATGLLTMGFASAICGVGLLAFLQINRLSFMPTALGCRILVDHQRYGRWASGTHALEWIPLEVWYPLLSMLIGLGAAGTFRALVILIAPIIQTFNALATLLIPTFVRAHRASRLRSLTKVANQTSFIVSAGYWLLLGLAGPWVLDLLYLGKYGSYAYILWVIGLVPVIGGLLRVYSGSLRARQRLDLLFRADLQSVLLTIPLGVLATALWGVLGASIGMVISLAAGLVYVIGSCRSLDAT